MAELCHRSAECLEDSEVRSGKLRVKWTGPYRVAKCFSDFEFEIEDLISGVRLNVHAERLRFYAESHLNVTTELLECVANNNQGYHFDELLDLRYNDELSRWELYVKWFGFPDCPAYNTWEPVESFLEDAPVVTKKYLKTFSDVAIREAVCTRFQVQL